jgi:hypothetical protein
MSVSVGGSAPGERFLIGGSGMNEEFGQCVVVRIPSEFQGRMTVCKDGAGAPAVAQKRLHDGSIALFDGGTQD